ncbi:hypothetical protein GDO78_001062 [Eleutherodactylus coqui]|uniref:Threonylcarbamoyl-AMP synthase n=1 Tax=Eleutherodactylus coqui TaxID=57060 RepID=A0A8J6KGD4_ELECQ|nr:hypothetical protein GDO78_001062 [Eleutherodactylus coqui]
MGGFPPRELPPGSMLRIAGRERRIAMILRSWTAGLRSPYGKLALRSPQPDYCHWEHNSITPVDRQPQGDRYCQVNVPDHLLRDLLPGPVTLVMERSDELNKELNPFTSLVGVRIPDHAFIRQLAQICSEPLALTSANLSTQPSTLSVEEFKDLWPMLSLVVDGGPIGDLSSPECRLGSTVVDLSIPGKFTIIRPGCALIPTLEILKNKYGLSSVS